MSLNMKTLTQAFAKASAVIEKTVQSAVQEVTGLPKPMQDYDLIDQIGSAGPGLAWKLYSAKLLDGHAPAVYSTVCVWVLDKKALSEARQRAGLSKAVEDTYLDLIRADASRLVRLRHPGVVHVVQALDESKNAMAMVTEPLFASVANALGDVGNLEKVPKELKGMEMGLLEVKHGLLQVAETLQFLHNNAHLVHRAISPETILITFNGAWKLGGFCFATSTDQSLNDSLNTQAFHYAEYDVEDSSLPLQPSINYTAPELVRSKSSTVGPSSDVFSLGCLAYHLITRKPLFDCHNNVKMYMNSLTYLTGEMFSAIPWELVPDLQRMLSVNESLRPTASDFTGSSFFREDTRLRALHFLDHMLERDNMKKTEFLKALSEMWKDFDPPCFALLSITNFPHTGSPPLCAELRNMVLQPMILPMVLKIAESQDKNDFEHSTMPALVPVLNSAASETLLLLVKHAELIINKASAEHLISHILPMLVRAYDDSDPRLQEEVLKRTIPLSRRLDAQLLKQAVLPRVHGLALKTTVAAVRVNALTCFAGMINLLEKSSVLEILQTIQRCTVVDHSAPTLMSTLSVANAILKQFGIEFVAVHVLPRLIPLLITQQLNTQQFAKYMFFVKDVLRQIEEKRGVTLTNPGIPAVKSMPTNEVYSSGQSNTTRSTSPSTTRRSSSWDEGWLPAKVSSPSLHSSTTKPGVQHPLSSQPTQGNSGYSVSSAVSLSSIQQSSPSCPAVDIEWPPSSGAPVFGGSDKVNGSSMTSSSSLDDVDPFSNWPPRSNATNISSQLNNGSMALSTGDSKTSTPSIGLSSHSSSQAFSFSNSQAKSQIQGTGLTENIFGSSNGPSSGSSLGILNQTSSTSSTHGSSSSDLKSIFASNKNEHGALRLAPPPTTPASRGRGRSRVQGSSAISSTAAHRKPHTQQPSLPNLL